MEFDTNKTENSGLYVNPMIESCETQFSLRNQW